MSTPKIPLPLPSMVVIMIISLIIFAEANLMEQQYFGKYIGKLKQQEDYDYDHHHGHSNNIIHGEIYLVNRQTIFLYNFSFPLGSSSESYFKVGSSRKPSSGPVDDSSNNNNNHDHGLIIPDELGRFNELGRYQNQNILLTLPKGILVSRIRWFSIWSKKFLKSLAEIRITKPILAPEMKNLGPLLSTDGNIKAKSVIAIDDKTIMLRKFNYNNNNCYDCGFFVGTGSGPNEFGIRIPDEKSSFNRLRIYFQENILLRLPRDLSLKHLDWFAIYDSKRRKNFGFVTIDRENLNVPPSMAFMLTYVTLFSNCETILPGLMHVSWEIRKPEIYFQLEARIASNQYAAFGLSGSPRQSRMIGSDVFIAYYDLDTNRVMLEDYTITAKSQCNPRTWTGVCRDTMVGGTNDLEILMSSYIDGFIKVTFRRPLITRDHKNDQSISPSDRYQNYLVAAIGTLDTHRNPSYHTAALITKYQRSKQKPVINVLSFGRRRQQRRCNENLWEKVINQPANIFNTISSELSGTEVAYELRPWKPAMIKADHNHVFHVVLGPAGSPQQGYTSITGNESPGIAFWINDLLIPELHVVRGHEYTFLIETGDNRTDRRRYHPFYLTNSRVGEGIEQLDQIGTDRHRVYAGIEFDDAGIPDPKPGTGRYCELMETFRVDFTRIHSIEEYRQTLRLFCGKGNVGSFRWRPDQNTPDTIFYQSFTQRNMGWKIKVSSNAQHRQQKNLFVQTTITLLLLLFLFLQ